MVLPCYVYVPRSQWQIWTISLCYVKVLRSLLLRMATTVIVQCWIKTAMWDWNLSYWNFREIALQNKNSTKASYKVSQIPYSPVPNIFIESQSFEQQNLVPTQHNSPQNTVSVWLKEINDRLSNLIIKKWNFCAKARRYKSDIQTVFSVYKEFHKTMLHRNDGRAVNHSVQDFMREDLYQQKCISWVGLQDPHFGAIYRIVICERTEIQK